MTEKKLIYESPWMEFLGLQLASSCLVAVSVNESMITDSDPYFDDLN